MIKDLVKDEDIHIKFVDAFLNLVSRVLNLPVRENNFVLLIRFKLNFHQPKIGRLFPDRGGQYHTF